MIFSPLPWVSIPLFLIGIINILIGIYIFVRRRNDTAIYFVLFCLSVSLWGIFISLMSSGLSPHLMPFGFKGAAWAGSFIPLFFLFVSYTFPDQKLSLPLFKVFLISLPCLFFAIISFTDIWLNYQIRRENVLIELVPYFTNTYLLYFFIYFGWSNNKFYQVLKNSSGVKRQQCLFFSLGILITSIIGIFCNIVLVYFKIGDLVYFGPLGTIFIVGFTAYAITEHRLMDIEVIIRKGTVYSIVVGFFTGMYLIAVFFVSQIFQAFTSTNSVFIVVPILLTFALLFQPVKNRVQEVIDKLFFKQKYDYQKTIRELSEATTSVVDLDALLELISRTVVERMKVEGASVYAKDDQGGYKLAKSYNVKSFTISKDI